MYRTFLSFGFNCRSCNTKQNNKKKTPYAIPVKRRRKKNGAQNKYVHESVEVAAGKKIRSVTVSGLAW
jgi:hypothetical protein